MKRALWWCIEHVEVTISVVFIGGMLLIGFTNGWT